MGPTPFYGAIGPKNPPFAIKQTNICRLSGDINNCSVYVFQLSGSAQDARLPERSSRVLQVHGPAEERASKVRSAGDVSRVWRRRRVPAGAARRPRATPAAGKVPVRACHDRRQVPLGGTLW